MTSRWWPRSPIRCRASVRTASRPRPWPWTPGSRNRSMPACRYCGSVTSPYWTRPATRPSTSTVNRVVSGSSPSGQASASSSPHQRRTSGVYRIRRSSPTSLSETGRSRTAAPRSSVTSGSVCQAGAVIVGVGVDVVDVARFAETIERTPAIVERVFTPEEQQRPLPSQAGGFAVIGAHPVRHVRAAETALMARLPKGALMQRAAAGLAARCALLLGGPYGSRVTLLVDGGDALFAGARLARRGARVDAVLARPDRVHAGGLSAFGDAGGRLSDNPVRAIAGADLVVDGLLGIGGSGGLREDAATLAELARERGGPVVAVRPPHGVHPDPRWPPR